MSSSWGVATMLILTLCPASSSAYLRAPSLPAWSPSKKKMISFSVVAVISEGLLHAVMALLCSVLRPLVP